MTREKLTEALARAVQQGGYTFLTGPAYRTVAETGQLPAAWLQSPKLEKTVGRDEGYRQYALTLSLMRHCPEAAAGEKEKLWAQMEADAAQVCRVLAAEAEVKAVDGPQYVPAEFSLTNMGEVSLTVNMTVRVSF